MSPGTHAVVKTEGGFRVMVALMESENGIVHYEFAEARAYPTRLGAESQAALLAEQAITPPIEERKCA